jgi:hypothetical protein
MMALELQAQALRSAAERAQAWRRRKSASAKRRGALRTASHDERQARRNATRPVREVVRLTEQKRTQ